MKQTFEQEIEESGKLIYTNVGDSMMPLLRQHRDLMIISKKPEGRLKRYDVPLYKRDSGQYVLHRILRVRKDDYVICGDNRYALEYGITDRHIIGVLTGVVRDGKEISVTDWKFRLYSHIWCDFFPIRAVLLRTKWKLAALKRKLRKK
ncbi:MAG: S24/S26 family peptidase [Oscillospiraceae bacterium]|nr:S24/S26 family peptidase [Oscillospiraceae bacterium]